MFYHLPTKKQTVCDSADLKNKRIYPKGSYGLFLTADKK